MSKFNNTPNKNRNLTKTHDGITAFQNTMYQDLCDRVLTCFYGQEKFYINGYDSNRELRDLITKVGMQDPMFLAKLTVLTREKFNLRSVTHVLTAELSRIVSRLNETTSVDTSVVRKVSERVTKRVDDVTEILAYLIYNYSKEIETPNGKRHINKKLSNQLKIGLNNALSKFDGYQLAKYKAASKELKLRDAFRILRPKPMDENQALLWGSLMDGTLKPAETWEVNISKSGQIDKTGKTKEEITKEVDSAKKDNWEKLIINKKLGYFAMIRNLRNIIDAGLSKEANDKAIAFITNENAVLNSKLFPFRFYSAYKALFYSPSDNYNRRTDPFSDKYKGKLTDTTDIKTRYMDALNKALWHSGKNVPKLNGRTLIATDLSGSMTNSLASESTVSYMEVGAVMSSIAQQYCEQSIVYGFGRTTKVIDIDERSQNPLDRVHKIVNTDVGHSTEFHKVIIELINKEIYVDQMFVFSDMQLNGTGYGCIGVKLMQYINEYQTKVNSNVKIYAFNLAAQDGSTQIDPKNPNFHHLSGWSDNLLKSVVEMETMKHGIIDMVNAVDL